MLDKLQPPQRDPNGPIRIPILDKMKDRGVIAFGKVESGTVEMGSKLTLVPNDYYTQVLNVYNSADQAVRYAKPGENVKLRLRIIEDENLVNKGDVLCERTNLMPNSEMFEAELDILQLIEHKPIISSGYQCVIHIHTVSDECHVAKILTSFDRNDKGEVVEKKQPRFVKSWTRTIVRIQTRIPICLEKHETNVQLGRFTLRDEGRTIAVGKVLRYKPAKKKEEDVKVVEEVKQEVDEEKGEQLEGRRRIEESTGDVPPEGAGVK